ncbi:hypothetical protein P9112_005103 [Eukaryota sp. TZLM1-RC]
MSSSMNEPSSRLSNNAFLNELSNFYSDSKEKGSVWLTMKRISTTTPTDQNVSVCLVRATMGRKTGRKISTLVYQRDHNRFHQSLTTIMKASFSSLKKKKRARHPRTTKKPVNNQ